MTICVCTTAGSVAAVVSAARVSVGRRSVAGGAVSTAEGVSVDVAVAVAALEFVDVAVVVAVRVMVGVGVRCD